MDTIDIALWSADLSHPIDGLGAWAALVERQMIAARAAGTPLLVMPEWIAAHWLGFAPKGLAATQEVAWMADQAGAALALLRTLVTRHQVALIAGTMPHALGGGRHANRAWVLLPDGGVLHQDKLCMTPGEKAADGWFLTPGNAVNIIDWRGLRLAITICLDVELPALASRLVEAAPDVLLVPSMTALRSGYNRVFGCARARAIELSTVVAAVGCRGTVTRPVSAVMSNHSGASIFLPCEAALGFDGLGPALLAEDGGQGDGPLLIASNLPVGHCRALRQGAAEVWPGPWRADHLSLTGTPVPAAAQ
jgi:predicted amidohydrolase